MPEGATRLVRFTARPPARLVAGGANIPAGATGLLPTALAEQLAANPRVKVELVDEPAPATVPEEESPE